MKDTENIKELLEFKSFTGNLAPWIDTLWKIYKRRKDPIKGMKYVYYKSAADYSEITFNRIELDNTFEKGTKFNYIFLDKDDNEVIIPTITFVKEGEVLTPYERKDLYSFWQCCYPLNGDDI